MIVVMKFNIKGFKMSIYLRCIHLINYINFYIGSVIYNLNIVCISII